MKNTIRLTVVLCAVASLSFVGCSGKDYSLSSVSGKVTSDGKAVPGIRVVFSPQSVEDNNIPGPWSTGKTNDQGEYTLTTRYKEKGAVPGKHSVTFEFDDGGGAEAMGELQEELDDLSSEEDAQEEIAKLKQRIAEVKEKMKGRPRISEDFSIEFEVPTGGTTDANFELPAD